MMKFKDIEDVDDWLEPMDYPGFWYATQPYDLVLQPRDHCDRQIAAGEIDQETVLEVLKYMARLELTERLGLTRRLATPWLKLVESY
ncbi:MAG: hypothetical protein H6853_00685 [Rhodospirillales bacterium]|nr:hypothetical protein [Alphaproteobacteria bacterium]USO03836.1 MAG: hypothetical protein H6853_00685 [Rhodospirillales bacterium]